MHAMDSNFVAEEMELYDEIRSTLDEDELLIIMSRLQEHFLEKLSFENEQRRLREEELRQFQSDTELTETDTFTNYDDTDILATEDDDATAPNSPNSIISSQPGDGSPLNNFAYIDDSNPFQLQSRESSHSVTSFKSEKSSKSNPGKNMHFFSQKGLTTANLNRHNNTASSMINKPNMGSTARPLTPSNKKMKYDINARPKRGFSEATGKHVSVMKSRNGAVPKHMGPGLLQSKSTSNPPSPTDKRSQSAMGLMTPQATAGAYRLDLFCDIKFVKNIFVRWISCKNEILNHVASRTLGILFSHSYLTPDQFLDLAELLLGVHDEKNNVFGNIEVTNRPTRTGLFFGDVSDSSSSPVDSDYQSTPEPEMSDSEESDLLDNGDHDKLQKAASNSTDKEQEKPDENVDSNSKEDDDGDSAMQTVDETTSNGHHPQKQPPVLKFGHQTRRSTDNAEMPEVNKNDAKFLRNQGRRTSVASSASSGSRSSRRSRVAKLPYDVDWDNRLYCAMKVLSYIVSNNEVYEGCVVALDEWFSIIVIDLFKRSRKAGLGVLEGYLHLIKGILTRFAENKDVMGQCKLSQTICSENAELFDIITSRTSTLVTRASALELCPLLMVTSELGSEQFAQHCLVSVLDDGRFNPFEPGDISMARTFQRGERGQLKSINEKNPLDKSYTVANYLPVLLFQRLNDVFIDQESVQRLTFLCVVKAMNILSQKIIAIEEAENKEKERKEAEAAAGIKEEEPIMSRKKSKKKNKKKKASQSDLFDQDASVEKLEGEFDATTARKIRNFFSRDAEYTRYRILELVEEEDDVLIETLLELLLIESSLRKSKSRLAVKVRYLFDPFMLFYDFIDCTDADYQFLLDFLISGETVFLEYLLRFCKRMSANWNPTQATKEQVNRVMSILIRLRMHVQDLYQKNAFPYSPKALLKAMEKVEFCYENEKGTFENQQKSNMFDEDYLNYMKRKTIREKEKVEKEKANKTKKISEKPKKMAISSLFLQDVKYQQEQQRRTSEIEQKKKEALKKRAERKKKKSVKINQEKTKRKTDVIPEDRDDDDEDGPPPQSKPTLMHQKSMATRLMKQNRENNKKSSKKKHNIKHKVNLDSLKKINFKNKLDQEHATVDAERKVRIGF